MLIPSPSWAFYNKGREGQGVEGERDSRHFILPNDLKNFFIWKIALQFCFGFCLTTIWISHVYKSLPFWTSLSSHHPTPLGHHRAQDWATCVLATSHCLFYTCILYCICQYIFILYMSMLLSQIIPPSPSPAVPTSLSSTRFISTIFLDSIYMC